uniref:Uncharacterized protein n=1 Tax=Panagrolaimus sp. JU765 TaxID=591449 RepID=A0AC34PWV8_9BILA
MDDLREPENSALWNKVVKLDEPTKKLLMDLQKRWLNEYEANRAKLLCELAQIARFENEAGGKQKTGLATAQR